MTYVQLRSAGFPNVHVRLDGSGVTHFLPPGGGVVNCQYGAGSLETFTRVDNTDGTVSFRSLPYNNVFLRMDGTGVIQPTGAGGGIVNAQYTAGPLEKFKIVSNDDGTSSIKSTAYNNVFLRTDGNGVTAFSPSGAGTVNCQFGIGHYEKLILCSCPTHDQVNAAIDQFTRAFPQQATQINNNRQRIMEACCPPFISTPPVFDSASLPPRLLKIQPRAEALNACDTAILNIIMDAIGMALSVVGFRLSGAVRESIFHTISRSPFTRLQVVLERLCIAWNQGGMARAHAFYEFFQKIWDVFDLFSVVFNALYNEMSWWQWLVEGVKAVAIIASWFLSEGALLVAEVVLLVLNAVDLSNHIRQAYTACGPWADPQRA